MFVYLFLTLPYVTLSVVIWWLRPDLRRGILILGAIGAALGLIMECWYLVDYWRPPTLLGSARQSFEDILFGASTMIIAVTGFAFFFKTKLPPLKMLLIKRAVPLGIASFGLMFLMTYIFSVNSIIASSVLVLVIALYALLRKPHLLPGALFTGALLVILTVVTYGVLFGIVSPQYIDHYFLLTNEPWNPTLFGFLPVAELIWYFAAGVSMGPIYHLLADQKTGTLKRAA